MEGKHTFMMGGIEVNFPYEDPYPSQKAMMSGAISAYLKFTNALLESPTGTGKSLALLASCLGYQEYIGHHPIIAPQKRDPYQHHNEELIIEDSDIPTEPTPGGFTTALQIHQANQPIPNPPEDMIRCNVVAKRHNVPVWYTSRTHQQLKQLVGELKKLPYHPQMTILASRKRICLNKAVANASSADAACYEAMRKKSCPYSTAKKIPKEFLPHGSLGKFDIEDLVNYCRQKMICPYSLSRTIMKVADLVFCPYNYILNPKVKGQMMLSILGVILIIDEAHNIENTIRECISFYHYRDDLLFSVVYCTRLMEKHKNSDFYEHLMVIRKVLSGYLQYFSSKTYYMREKRIQEYIENDNLKFFESLGMTKRTWPRIRLALDYFFVVSNGSIIPDTKEIEKISMALADVLEQLYCVLAVCFKLNLKFINSFKFVVKLGATEEKDQLMALCMDPGCYFTTIADEVNSIVLSSGTLTPIHQLPYEFSTDFPIRISTPHVIDPSQILSFTIQEAEDGTQFLSTYSYLTDNGYKVYLALGKTIYDLINSIPGGVLFFLPSHHILKDMLHVWINEGIYDKINETKKVFYENSDVLSDNLYNDYKLSIEENEGALLIGVCRGKMSEGIDFYDDQSRAVIIFGIPYPPFQELEIRLKRQYNDEKVNNEEGNEHGMNGDEWYDSQAYRALFQATGRCIRHKGDYGAIILLDSRFSKNIDKFPRWIRNNFKINVDMKEVISDLNAFFNEMKKRFPKKITFNKHIPSFISCKVCGNNIIKLESLNGYTLKSYEKNLGLYKILKKNSKEPLLFIPKNDRKLLNNTIIIDDIIWCEEDLCGYQLLKCCCRELIGCVLTMGTTKDIPFMDGAWFSPSCTRIVQEKFVGLLEDVIEIKKTMMFVPQGKGQQILCPVPM
ncbi:Fanconi anemia group J protein isoform X2 [Histomonas meleagridis]|uniref:Fanconi anemia group J protein-like isoform X2 n=1 Tax=Histomonas meleagridis TaxID=135588 RepID=UPI003559903F|nr:Fanconi anemia group J protein isoform X2 [Histomonas meleagridis]KAH0799652.1 Fanconi anemia group J protein-like isoform X2 [Histomonas meleagridis]